MNPRVSALVAGVLTALTACADPERVAAPILDQPEPSALHVPAADTYTQMSVGNSQTCALRADGAMQCWGRHDENGASPPLQFAGIGYYTAIGAGMAHTCAVRIDGAIECFSRTSTFGQAEPLYIPQAGNFVDVGAGRLNTCGLRDDGVVECFGEGTASPQRIVTADVGFFTQLGVGGQHGCALRNDGVVQCWGGYDEALEAPHTKAASTGYFTQVAGGDLYSCALRNDGAVECWGYGFMDGRDPALKTAVTGYFTSITAASDHACGVRSDGKIECWGMNRDLQAPRLKVASNGGRFIDVDGGAFHTCGLRDDHTIQCWGRTEEVTPGSIVYPTATLVVPASVVVGAPIRMAVTNAQVPGHPSATTFTYAWDCIGNGHFDTWYSGNTATCPTTVTGTKRVYALVRDEDGNYSSLQATVMVNDLTTSTTDLKTAVSIAVLSPDLRKALNAKITAALDAMAKGNTQVACTALQDFINQVKAQRGKAIPTATADLWIQQATDLRVSAGC